jgi:hypothetical protein
MENMKHRIDSVLNSKLIGVSIDGISNFDCSELKNVSVDTITITENLRLGKQVERIFSALISSSSNYEIIEENIQIVDEKITIGEFDFILKNTETDKVFHLELVYKFYIYDPNQSDKELEKWIGPNRKDSFIEKFTKLEQKQFPLLQHPITKSQLLHLNIDEIEQKLCFMASLFVPYQKIGDVFPVINNKAIVGYWLTLNQFERINTETFQFYLPQKKEWGMSPKHHNNWESLELTISKIKESHTREFSPLCWIKKDANTFEQCFIVWW